jgi:ABC-type glycerol-3-phosphate transport system substrate-binding protein
MKKLLLALVAVSLLVLGCAKGQKAANEPKSLVVWSFTDEVKNMIDKYYGPANPDVKIEYSLTPTDQFPNKLDPVLASGQGAPDVFALEAAFVRKYIESGLLLDLTDVANEVKSKMFGYPIEVGTYNGKVYGLSWQVTPVPCSIAEAWPKSTLVLMIQQRFRNTLPTLISSLRLLRFLRINPKVPV